MNLKFLIFFLIPFVSNSQSDVCEAIVYWRHTEKIDLYNMPNGAIFQSLQNDLLNEDYVSLVILAETKDFFYGDFIFGKYNKSYKGWVKKSKYIGAFSKNEQEIQDLTLFTEPNSENSLKIELTEWKSSFITVTECKGDWKMISLDYKGDRITGWIESSKLCANNYSSCS